MLPCWRACVHCVTQSGTSCEGKWLMNCSWDSSTCRQIVVFWRNSRNLPWFSCWLRSTRGQRKSQFPSVCLFVQRRFLTVFYISGCSAHTILWCGWVDTWTNNERLGVSPGSQHVLEVCIHSSLWLKCAYSVHVKTIIRRRNDRRQI